MSIIKLPTEIIEKILILVNDFSVCKVCKKWEEIILYKIKYITECSFDLLNDDPKIFKTLKIKNLNLYFSKIDCDYMKYNLIYQKFLDKIYLIFYFCPYLININIILDLGLFVSDKKTPSSNIFYINNWNSIEYFLNSYGNSSTSITLENYRLCFLLLNELIYKLYIHKEYANNVCIKIKDYFDKFNNDDDDYIKNINLYSEHYKIDFFINNNYINYNKFSFSGPNGFYIIYDSELELLIIRFPNIKKYKDEYYKFNEILPNNINIIYNKLCLKLTTYKTLYIISDIFQNYINLFCLTLKTIETIKYYCFENKPEMEQYEFYNPNFEFIHLNQHEDINYNFFNILSTIKK